MGGYLSIPESRVDTLPRRRLEPGDFNQTVAVKRFQDVSSTRLELETMLWALEEYSSGATAAVLPERLLIHSDSQAPAGLLSRRKRLEENGFYSKRGRSPLKNASLYRLFYTFHDQLKFDVVQTPGPMPSRFQDANQRVFACVHRCVRQALRQWVGSLDADGPWHVYMIRCRDQSLYTGISNDVARRFEAHKKMGKQGAKYLRGRGPLELVFDKKAGSRSSALKMERMIKKYSKAKKELIVETGEIDSVLGGGKG